MLYHNIMYWILGAFILGMIIFSLARPYFWKLVRRFQNRAPLIKKYWLVVVPFLISTIAAYVLVAIYANQQTKQTDFEIVGQASGLLFAVFVGFVAFAEWSKAKFDDLASKGRGDAEVGRFKAASMSLEEAYSLQPKDLGVMADLLELYLITNQEDKFDQKIKSYKSAIVEQPDMLKYYFLSAVRFLLVENLRSAKEIIKEAIEFVSENKNLRPGFGWSLASIQRSDPYKSLNAGTQRTVNNLYSYLGGSMSDNKEAAFIQGQYDTQDIE